MLKLSRIGALTGLGLAVGVVVCLWLPAQAQEEVSPEKQPISIWQLIRDSGVIGFAIIGLSVVMVALVIDNALASRRDALLPRDLVVELGRCCGQLDVARGLELCGEDDSFISRVVEAALTRFREGYPRMREAMEDAGQEISTRLEQRIAYLALIATVAPMLGLLGTVSGMIRSFDIVARLHNPGPAELAPGIRQALVTTFQGLVVAIPAMVAHGVIRNRVSRILMQAAQVGEELLGFFKQATPEEVKEPEPESGPLSQP